MLWMENGQNFPSELGRPWDDAASQPQRENWRTASVRPPPHLAHKNATTVFVHLESAKDDDLSGHDPPLTSCSRFQIEESPKRASAIWCQVRVEDPTSA